MVQVSRRNRRGSPTLTPRRRRSSFSNTLMTILRLCQQKLFSNTYVCFTTTTLLLLLLISIITNYSFWTTTTIPSTRFSQSTSFQNPNEDADAIIIGGGLAGLTAALTILDRGGRVLLLEKNTFVGGNAVRASSGINACCPNGKLYGDSLQSFRMDTIQSAGSAARLNLIDALIDRSADTLDWLKTRVGVDLSLVALLGGHSHKRTHRPPNSMVGAEMISGLSLAVESFRPTGRIEIRLETAVTKLLVEEDTDVVFGVEAERLTDGSIRKFYAPQVLVATGGYASDRRSTSFIAKYRPELMGMATTAGPFSTGDGITLASEVGAGMVDMEKVQVHPTGWVDPADPENPTKVLAAEVLRGVGGILLDKRGKRFCNELGTRDYVSTKMLEHPHANSIASSTESTTTTTKPIPTFTLVLSSAAADETQHHKNVYTRRGLLRRFEGIDALSKWMNVDVDTLKETFQNYQTDAQSQTDAFGKSHFFNLPLQPLEEETFYAGTVSPVVHYCMGGIKIDEGGDVLEDDGRNKIKGLYAAGEVAGGVHGKNRLGGNSLLECTVYGRIVGDKITISGNTDKHGALDQWKRKSSSGLRKRQEHESRKKHRDVTMTQLGEHNKQDDCWVALYGKVYDLTKFAESHPGGKQLIWQLAGKDGTELFEQVHSPGILAGVEQFFIGTLKQSSSGRFKPAKQLIQPPAAKHAPRKDKRKRSNRFSRKNDPISKDITVAEVKLHDKPGDCWVALHGKVFDLTSFAKRHPGGREVIWQMAGKDGTNLFESMHDIETLEEVERFFKGTLKASSPLREKAI